MFLYIASRNSHNSKWGYYELSEFLKEKGVRKLFVYAIDDSACPRDLLNEIDSKSIRKRKSVNGDGISDIELSIQLFQAAQGIIIENVNSELEYIDTNRIVFISHSHSDNAVAEDVYNYLSKNGIKCWIDLHHIPAGIPYAQAIMNELQSSDTMVVLYSKNVIESHDMLDELQEAHTTNKRIIPFLLDKTPLFGQFRYYLARRQWINASQTYQRSLNELVLALKDNRLTGFEDNNSNYNIDNSHKFVDLGLSIKWATCNVGANTPEEYGDYFAWGETDPKQRFTNDNYLYKGNPVTLPLSADAAHVNWGENWRMPTKQEQEELYNNCTWEWTNMNAVKGYKVIGKNGNYIFLPAGGYMSDNIICDGGKSGYYWSGMLSNSNSNNSSCLYFLDSYVNRCYNARYFGQTIRPVHQ